MSALPVTTDILKEPADNLHLVVIGSRRDELFIFFQKVSYTPEKVSPEKTSDWFCNSFDSRAARNKSNGTVLSKTSHPKRKSKQMEQKVDEIQ